MTYTHNIAGKLDDVAGKFGDRVALNCGQDESVTFTELRERSLIFASFLSGKGISKGEVIAILNDKSPDGFAFMLGCLRIGAIYTNLDPESPPERLKRILDQCQPALVVSCFDSSEGAPVLTTLGELGMEVVPVTEAGTIGSEEQGGDFPEVTGSDPAYLMFTSGSTGYPKGAVISHGSLLNFVDWAADCFEITPDDVLTNVNPIYFDNSVFDFYASVFNGATLAPASQAVARDPRRLVAFVAERNCTIWFSVPSLLVYLLTTRALKSTDFPSVRKIIFGGEGFPKPKLKQLFDLFGDRIDLENVYGPTEGTCICSAHTVGESDFEDMSILTTLGFIAKNFGYEILPQGEDENFGELFLTGPQVGIGYFRDPERTADSFVQNPMHNDFRDIGYRTGDLVQRDEKGHLHFKGRVDFQIKHMGYRIELEEIESALNLLKGVREAVALYETLGDGLGMILGYVAADSDCSPDELLADAARYLPPYMMPKRIAILEVLPKNANGKIDRGALRANN